jgi:hypothetical protein
MFITGNSLKSNEESAINREKKRPKVAKEHVKIHTREKNAIEFEIDYRRREQLRTPFQTLKTCTSNTNLKM